MTTGFGSIRAIREDFGIPIIVGRDMYAPLSLQPDTGISPVVLGKLARACGADFFYVGSVAGKLRNEILEIKKLSDVLRDKSFGNLHTTLPLISCGIHPGNIHLNLAFLGTQVAIQAGGGIHGHPRGTRFGAVAMRAAVDLAYSGTALSHYAKYPGAKALQEALAYWGRDEIREDLRGLATILYQD
jgi:ribulose-bisphosphate carboxylase large chain